MTFSRKCATALLLLSFGGFARADASSQGSSGGPSKAKPASSTVCFSVEEATKVDVKLIEQARDIALLRARSRKFGGVVGCGVGIVAEVSDGKATLDAAPFCGIVYGIRF